MANNDNTTCTELSKLTDKGKNNNFGEWKTKSYHKLHKWNLLQYIEGDTSIPPAIPALRQAATHHGIDKDGNVSIAIIPGNEAEFQNATTNAKPWLTGNNTALSRIIATMPSHLLYLVDHEKYAKTAWTNLSSYYLPQNSLHAATIKHQITNYACTPNMNIPLWLNDLLNLHHSLTNLNMQQFTNHNFTLTILDLMPQDDIWRKTIIELRGDIQCNECDGKRINPLTIVNSIWDEWWFLHKDDL